MNEDAAEGVRADVKYDVDAELEKTLVGKELDVAAVACERSKVVKEWVLSKSYYLNLNKVVDDRCHD